MKNKLCVWTRTKPFPKKSPKTISVFIQPRELLFLFLYQIFHEENKTTNAIYRHKALRTVPSVWSSAVGNAIDRFSDFDWKLRCHARGPHVAHYYHSATSHTDCLLNTSSPPNTHTHLHLETPVDPWHFKCRCLYGKLRNVLTAFINCEGDRQYIEMWYEQDTNLSWNLVAKPYWVIFIHIQGLQTNWAYDKFTTQSALAAVSV